ncbi:MAG: tetratricopeptide repeat protein [Fimbriimonas sp.]
MPQWVIQPKEGIMALWNKWFGFAQDEVFEEGMAAYDRGDFDKAIEAFEGCIENSSDPNEVRLSRFYFAQSSAEMGHELMRSGDPYGALGCYQQALKLYPKYPDLNLAIAKAYRELGDGFKQSQHVAQALESNPRYVDAILFEGITWYETGRTEEGLARINHACQLDPHINVEAYQRALECHASGDQAGTIKYLMQMCCTSSADAMLHLRVGDSFLRDRDYEAAIEEYRKALEAAPDHSNAHCRLGTALLAADRASESVGHLNAAVRLNPGNAEAHAQLGLAYEALQQKREAGREFLQVLKLNPDHPVASRYKNAYAL